LGEQDADHAIATVREFMETTHTKIASWWLTELSTPGDVEERLLDGGLVIVDDDYHLDGLLLTREPPAGPPDVVARPVESAAEYVAATESMYEAFDLPADRRRDEAGLVAEHELRQGADAEVVYAAWTEGTLVGYARSMQSPVGVFMSGGSVLPSARGRGVYRALVRARWDDAVARGTPALAVSAGAMSSPILRRLGFERTCQFRRLQDVRSSE
jgi:GNAT superfamily N-acetyltransferase